jgi:hypothetical protein
MCLFINPWNTMLEILWLIYLVHATLHWKVLGSNPFGGKIFRFRPYWSWGPPSVGTGSYPWVKRPRRGVNHPPPFSAEVKERLVLYAIFHRVSYIYSCGLNGFFCAKYNLNFKKPKELSNLLHRIIYIIFLVTLVSWQGITADCTRKILYKEVCISVKVIDCSSFNRLLS